MDDGLQQAEVNEKTCARYIIATDTAAPMVSSTQIVMAANINDAGEIVGGLSW